MANFVTHYQIWKLVNFRLVEENLDEVTSQMIYGALKNKPAMDLEDPATLAWIEQYVENRRTGKTNRGASVNPETFWAKQRTAQAQAESGSE